MITWKEFKEHVEASGADDDTVISWIDIHMPYDTEELNARVNEDNELAVS